MEHRALLSKVITLLFLVFTIESCNTSIHSPERFIRRSDAALKHSGEQLLYHDTLFSGVLYEMYNEKDTALSEKYLDGLRNNISRKWFPSGKLSEERSYVNGKRIGIHQGWYPDGKKRFLYHFVNDEVDGLAEDWYADGKPMKRMNYVNGHESGMQTAWESDGSIMANYMAKNGRNYGLTGVKNCKNVKDSIK